MIAWKHLLPDRGKSRNDTEKFSSVFGTAQKMSQLGDIGYSTLTDFSPFWGPSWDPLKEQICSVNNYVMIVVAGIARAWWDATRLHTPTAFSEQLGAVCGWSRWSPWQVWGYKARDSPLKVRFLGHLDFEAVKIICLHRPATYEVLIVQFDKPHPVHG